MRNTLDCQILHSDIEVAWFILLDYHPKNYPCHLEVQIFGNLNTMVQDFMPSGFLSFCSFYVKVQRQLQMRIEAQGKYLQKIIEEQQKLSSVLKGSEALPLVEDVEGNNENQSESQLASEASQASQSPPKKQKLDDPLQSNLDPSPIPSENSHKQDVPLDRWDRNLYGSVAGLGLDLETEPKGKNLAKPIREFPQNQISQIATSSLKE